MLRTDESTDAAVEVGQFVIAAIVMLNHIFARLLIVLQTLSDQENRQNLRLKRLEDSQARIEAALARIEDVLTPAPAVSLNLTAGPVVEQP